MKRFASEKTRPSQSVFNLAVASSATQSCSQSFIQSFSSIKDVSQQASRSLHGATRTVCGVRSDITVFATASM